MKALYFDCFSGISGDMILGAFVDMGLDLVLLKSELDKLNLDGYTLTAKQVVKKGVSATKIDVETEHCHHHRTLSDIINIINASGISQNAKELSKAIFTRLAVAESKVHNSTPDQVHFHEVGAIDSIVDIVGCAICIDLINPDKIFASPLKDGYGFVDCQHGKIPVPVPAVCELVKERNALFSTCEIEGELITPTGAAILCEIAEEFIYMPKINVISKGYGAGTKDLDIPNLLRVFVGEIECLDNSIWLLETNLDDMTPEALGFAMEQLFEHGALDVYYTPIYMKKNRPAYMLSVICNDRALFEELIFKHTSALGMRCQNVDRATANRHFVDIPNGGGRLKVWQIGDVKKHAPEYESVVLLAKQQGKSFFEVYDHMMRYGYETIYNK